LTHIDPITDDVLKDGDHGGVGCETHEQEEHGPQNRPAASG
jgi:hypothetical protein